MPLYTIHINAEVDAIDTDRAEETVYRLSLIAEQWGATIVTATARHGVADTAGWRIVSLYERDDDNRPLYWSNTDGWQQVGDRFDHDEIAHNALPEGGAWVPSSWWG